MAKGKGHPSEKEVRVVYPSQFGSHTSMIDQEATEKLEDGSRVVLRDEFGLYETDRDRLDSGLADPNRYKSQRLHRLFARKSEDK